MKDLSIHNDSEGARAEHAGKVLRAFGLLLAVVTGISMVASWRISDWRLFSIAFALLLASAVAWWRGAQYPLDRKQDS